MLGAIFQPRSAWLAPSPAAFEDQPCVRSSKQLVGKLSSRQRSFARRAIFARQRQSPPVAEAASSGVTWLPWARAGKDAASVSERDTDGTSGSSLRSNSSTSMDVQPVARSNIVSRPTRAATKGKTSKEGSTSRRTLSTSLQPTETEPPSSLPYWRLVTGASEPEVAVPPARLPAEPIVSCAGGGIFFFWETGVMKYLMEQFDLSRVQLRGASAGGLAVTLAACGVNQDKAVRAAYRLSVENNIWDRPGGLVGIWGGLVRQWLDELLPEDAAERCNGRVKVVVTELPSLQLKYLSNFTSREDLINANMASVHIPFLLDGKGSCTYRGKQYMDGSLYDFVFGNNSNLLTCNGDALVVDYFNDDQLQFSRLDFVKLAQFDEVAEMERCGYAYAERMDLQGAFDSYLGPVRKGVVRRVIEYPVRQISRVLASVDLA